MSELTKELRAQANQHQLDADLSYFDIAATKIEELEQQLKQQWVSVDDGLPDEDTPVFVWDGCDYDIDYTDMECDYGTTFFANTQGVTTHWMPLPKPPTK